MKRRHAEFTRCAVFAENDVRCKYVRRPTVDLRKRERHAECILINATVQERCEPWANKWRIANVMYEEGEIRIKNKILLVVAKCSSLHSINCISGWKKRYNYILCSFFLVRIKQICRRSQFSVWQQMCGDYKLLLLFPFGWRSQWELLLILRTTLMIAALAFGVIIHVERLTLQPSLRMVVSHAANGLHSVFFLSLSAVLIFKKWMYSFETSQDRKNETKTMIVFVIFSKFHALATELIKKI